MIDASFVKSISDLAAVQEFDAKDGRKLYSSPLQNIPLPTEPLVDTLHIATLTGLVDFLKGEGSKLTDILLHVVSATMVRIHSAIKDEHRHRDTFVEAATTHDKFAYNAFVPHAQFMIALQAQFADYGDRAKVLQVLGTIRHEDVKTSLDDGRTQRVTASAGVILATEISVPNPVLLKPFRTFSEVDQPPSNFVLRVQKGREGELPQCALFEADGGHWKLEAIQNVKAYLAEKLPNAPIIA